MIQCKINGMAVATVITPCEGGDIPGDNVSDGASSMPSFISKGNDHPHFKYAFNKGVNKNRKELADFLKAQGVADYKSQAKKIVKQINTKKE